MNHNAAKSENEADFTSAEFIAYYTPRCKHLRNINNIHVNKLIHRPEEGLDFKSEYILVSAMVHLPPGMKLWSTNKHGKVVLNEKTINGLHGVCSCIVCLLKHVCSSLDVK